MGIFNNKRKTKVVTAATKQGKPTAKKTTMAVFLAMVVSIGSPMALKHEGMKLKPYYDSVGVLTWCIGETEVGYKKEFTEQECKALFTMRYGFYAKAVYSMYNDTAKEIVTPEFSAAMTDMAYNVGISAVRKSSMIREINAGNGVKACDAIKRYKYAGGKDCSKPNNRTCRGVWSRRLEMHELCLSGLAD